MNAPAQAAFESFLVEDVILTLGNLRGSLGWLGEAAAKDRAWVERLDRQLGLLEDRARRLAGALREDATAEPANLFAAAADRGIAGPSFRSRRGWASRRTVAPPAGAGQAARPSSAVLSAPSAISATITRARSSASTSK